jgi:transglutaminase-like putative cysteine protease
MARPGAGAQWAAMNSPAQLPSSPVRLRFRADLQYEVRAPGCDFIFNVQAARTAQQRVISEKLEVSQPVEQHAYVDPTTNTRLLRLRAQEGPLRLRCESVVDIEHYRAQPGSVAEVPIAQLPAHTLPYLYPSRYCQSDRLHRFAFAEFGGLKQGYERVRTIRDWVQSHVEFTSNSSDGNTSACDTLVTKQGVCRDFAHLMIALCRAVNIPARFATGMDYGADPALGPPDFHAYVEAYLGGRWYMFDPSGTAIPMGFVRLATGRDAADCAFASIFGSVEWQSPVIEIQAIAGADGIVREPVHGEDALSTDAAPAGA